MKKGKPDLIITTIRADRQFWSKVRTRAFEEKISVGALTLKALAEYLKREGEK
jgi:predicted DNA-binding ribbon-helix-helix protein